MAGTFATYHGGGPRAMAPAYAGAFAPGSARYVCDWIPAKDLFPWSASGQNNPVTMELYRNPVGQQVQVCVFPQATIGGSWVRYSTYPPCGVDTSVNPYFRLVWTVPASTGVNPGVADTVNFHGDWGAFNDGDAFGGTGPGTQQDRVAAGVDTIQITPEIQIPNTSGFVWAAGAYAHGNIYRGVPAAQDIVGPVYLIGVVMRWTLA